MFDIKKWLFGADDTTPSADDLQELRTALTTAREEITRLKAERDAFEQKFKDADARATQLATAAETLRETVEQLKADMATLQTQLSNIAKTPADQTTGGDTPPAEGGDTDKKRAYQHNPLNKHIYKD